MQQQQQQQEQQQYRTCTRTLPRQQYDLQPQLGQLGQPRQRCGASQLPPEQRALWLAGQGSLPLPPVQLEAFAA
jgi:hypothetical protein